MSEAKIAVGSFSSWLLFRFMFILAVIILIFSMIYARR
jgi:hypothetical protein